MSDIRQLLDIMAKLRGPGGCPWDREQTFASIAPYTLEEAYEVAEAIRLADMAGLAEELGDLLLQVVYHARMAEEAGHFAFADVVAGICAKMIRRHPHVFGDAEIADRAAQTDAWERLKAAERDAAAGAPASLLDGIPRTMPALMRALKLQQRAARLGFDWPDVAGPLAKLAEEADELAAALAAPDRAAEPAADDPVFDEIGDVLFTCVNLARKLGCDPEAALAHANAKFERRFRALEEAAATRGEAAPLPLARLEALWQDVKKAP